MVTEHPAVKSSGAAMLESMRHAACLTRSIEVFP